MCRASAEDKYYAIRLIKGFSKNVKKLKTHVESHWDPECYMFYMNIFYVIGCKNIHTVLLKLCNQFYMNILYEIVSKNVHTFMKKNIWILLANFCWNKYT